MDLEQSRDFRGAPSGGEHGEDFGALRLGEFRSPPAMTAFGAGRLEPSLRAFLHHFALVFSEGAEHLHHHPAGGYGRVDT